MPTSAPDEPLKDGTYVKILHSGFHRARIAGYLGPLAPKGVRLYRVLVQRKPWRMYTHASEDEIEVLEQTPTTS